MHRVNNRLSISVKRLLRMIRECDPVSVFLFFFVDQFYVVMHSDTQLSVRSRVGGRGVSPALQDHVQICPDSCRGKMGRVFLLPSPSHHHYQPTPTPPPKPTHPLLIVMGSAAGPDQEARDFFSPSATSLHSTRCLLFCKHEWELPDCLL